jgi:hypothetical protein
MPDEFPEPQKIWQEQPMEAIQMSLDEIRRKARELQTKGRFASFAWITIGLILTIAFAVGFVRAHDLLPRIGFGVLGTWGLYGAWQAYRWMWPGILEAGATYGASLDFYGGQLERRRDYVRDIWRMPVLWLFFVGLALVIAPALIGTYKNPRLLLNAVPFFVLLLIWFIAFFYIRRRDWRSLQREIDELKTLRPNDQ